MTSLEIGVVKYNLRLRPQEKFEIRPAFEASGDIGNTTPHEDLTNRPGEIQPRTETSPEIGWEVKLPPQQDLTTNGTAWEYSPTLKPHNKSAL